MQSASCVEEQQSAHIQRCVIDEFLEFKRSHKALQSFDGIMSCSYRSIYSTPQSHISPTSIKQLCPVYL